MTVHPQAEAFRILDEWEALYAKDDSEAPLPMTFIEETYPEQFGFFTQLFIDAETRLAARPTDFGLPAHFDIDLMQGYHDEWPPLIAAAREELS